MTLNKTTRLPNKKLLILGFILSLSTLLSVGFYSSLSAQQQIEENDPVSGILSVASTTVYVGEKIELTIIAKDEQGIREVCLHHHGDWDCRNYENVTSSTTIWSFSESVSGQYRYVGYIYGLKPDGSEEANYTQPKSATVRVREKEEPNDPISATISVSTTTVSVGEKISLIIEAKDQQGVDEVCVYSHETWFCESCWRKTFCRKSWIVFESSPGTSEYVGYAFGFKPNGWGEGAYTGPGPLKVEVIGAEGEIEPEPPLPPEEKYVSPEEKYVSGEIIIKFKESPKPRESNWWDRLWQRANVLTEFRSINKLNKEHKVSSFKQLFKGEEIKGKTLLSNVYKFKVESQENIDSVIAAYRADPNVEYAEPNYIRRALEGWEPNDPDYNLQWHLHDTGYAGIKMPGAWNLSKGSGVIVAVLDSGIAYEDYVGPPGEGYCEGSYVPPGCSTTSDLFYKQAPDLARTCFVAGYDFVNDDEHPNDDDGHGTHVAGTIAQSTDNNWRGAGIAFEACLMPIKVLDANGWVTTDDFVEGIYWAVSNGADIINISIGGYDYSQTEENAVTYAWEKGVTLVAVVGNEGVYMGPGYVVTYPAAFDKVIAVGAVDYFGNKPDWSNYGPILDLVAPGEGIWQETFEEPKKVYAFDFLAHSGTSMAAPHVSGVAALALSLNNELTPDEVRGLMQEIALRYGDLGEPGKDDYFGYGLIDAHMITSWAPFYPPVPIAVPNGPYYGEVNQPIVFDGSDSFSSDSDIFPREIEEYRWDFGDGNSITVEQPTVQHTYDRPGVYTVTLVVNNGDRDSDPEGPYSDYYPSTTTATVEAEGIFAEISFPQENQIIRENINIIGSAHPSYILEFGLGENPTEWEVIASGDSVINDKLGYWNIVSLEGGVYTLKLTAKDNGNEVEDRVRMEIEKIVHFGKGDNSWHVWKDGQDLGLYKDESGFFLKFSAGGELGTFEFQTSLYLHQETLPEIGNIRTNGAGVDIYIEKVEDDSVVTWGNVLTPGLYNVKVVFKTGPFYGDRWFEIQIAPYDDQEEERPPLYERVDIMNSNQFRIEAGKMLACRKTWEVPCNWFARNCSKMCGEGTVDSCKSCLLWLGREASCHKDYWTGCLENPSCGDDTIIEEKFCLELKELCLDGTFSGQCSESLPLYCDEEGKLINDCGRCGCPEGEMCREDGSCSSEPLFYKAKCRKTWEVPCRLKLSCSGICGGGMVGTCESCWLWGKKATCYQDYWIDCSESPSCGEDQLLEKVPCYPPCADGTPEGMCSEEKPKYCDRGELIDRCQECGCPPDYECQENGTCQEKIFDCGNPATFIYKGEEVAYGTVESLGKCWMDRNLGASRVATAYNDSAAYGDLFQWGRLDDGHQTRTSGTTSTLSSTDSPGHDNFITVGSAPYDWRTPQNDSLWQGVFGANNPCPPCWRVPTFEEWNNERGSWSQSSYHGAFNSPLKLTASGYRYRGSGSLTDLSTEGHYWSTRIRDSNAYYLNFTNEYTALSFGHRSNGRSVRCILDKSCLSICPDGTPDKMCSEEKPKYCDRGELIDRCQECGCPQDYKCQEAGTCQAKILDKNILKLGAIKIKSSSGVEPEALVNKILTILRDKKVDLIVTPEYTFYKGYETHPIDIDCTDVSCTIEPTDTVSQSLVDGIKKIQDLAKANKTSVVLGTVAEIVRKEEYPELSDDIVFNTQLVIDKNGNIIGKKRKTIEWFSSSFECRYGQDSSCRNKAYSLALDTVAYFTLTYNESESFRIFPLICGERDNKDMLEKAKNYKADIVVNSEREGDSQYEEITRDIQNDKFDPKKWGWDWMIEDIFIEEYINERNVVKENGWLLVSEGGASMGGVINLNIPPSKLKILDITEDYVYGELFIPLSE